MIKWLFHNIDYFSRPVQITFDDREKYSTILGKILSLVIYCLTVALIVNSWNSLLDRVNPKTSTTNTYKVDSPLMNLSELNSIYIVLFQTSDFLAFNDPSYIKFVTNLFEVKRYDNGTSSFNYFPLKQMNCSKYRETFNAKGFQKDFDINYLDKGICIDLNSRDIVLGGNFANNYFSNFVFSLKKCVNSSHSDVICKSQDEIDDKIKGSFLQFFYFDNFVDLNNYSKVFNENFIHNFISLDPKFSKLVDCFFKYVNVSSDFGIVFESTKYESAVSFDYYKEQIDISSNNDFIIKFYVNSSNNYVYYRRIYTKFQEFAATTGGLLKIMTFFGSLITSTFTRYEMHEKMFNSVFDFSNNKSLNKDCKKKEISIKENMSNIPIVINPLSKNDYLSASSQKKNIKLNNNKKYYYLFLKNKLNSHTKKNNEIKLGIYHVLKMKICFRNKKEQLKLKLIKLATQKITKYLDYLKISKILVDFNRVKKIIFTKPQRKIFSISSKSKLCVEDMNENKAHHSKVEKSEEEKYLSLVNYYCLLRDNKNDPMNERILNHLDEIYKNIFDEFIYSGGNIRNSNMT
jgi:hypothetical protein